MSGQGIMGKMWRLLFPLLLYECLTVFYPEVLGLVTGGRLLEPSSAMWLLTLENVLMLPVFRLLYRQDRKRQTGGMLDGEPGPQKLKMGAGDLLLTMAGAVCLSRGLNYLLALTPLPYYFPGYQAAAAHIIQCSLWSQICASVVSASLLEELLVRGILYGRLKEILKNPRTAMAASALVFGLYHGNVVQGLYAFVMGLFFVRVYEAGHSLLPAVLAHMAANNASVLAGQVKLAGENAAGNPAVYYCITAVFLLAGAWCWRYFARKSEAGR